MPPISGSAAASTSAGNRRKAFVWGQRPPWIDRQSRRAARRRFRLAEQAPWPHDQHRGHHQKHQDDGNLRKDQDAEGVEFRHQHRGDKGADDAAETADHHHHEHVDDDAQVQRVVHGVARNLQRAAKRGKKNAEREYAGEQPFLIDAECSHHVAVLGRGADQHAPAGALEQQPQDSSTTGLSTNQEQVVGRNILAEKNPPRREIPGRGGRSRSSGPQISTTRSSTIKVRPKVASSWKQFRRMIDPPQQHHLDQHADRRDDQGRDDDAAPKSERAGKSLGQRERDVSAEHVERAMREIDDPRHAENDRQPRRHQEQRRRAGKAGQELNEVEGHQRSAVAVTSPRIDTDVIADDIL